MEATSSPTRNSGGSKFSNSASLGVYTKPKGTRPTADRIRSYTLLFALGLMLLVTGLWGLGRWSQAGWFRQTPPYGQASGGAWTGYDGDSFLGLEFFSVCFPLGVMVMLGFGQQLLAYPLPKLNFMVCKIIFAGVMVIVTAVGCKYSWGWSWAMMGCGLYGCVDSVKNAGNYIVDYPEGWQAGAGMALFFINLILCLIFFGLFCWFSWKLYRHFNTDEMEQFASVEDPTGEYGQNRRHVIHIRGMINLIEVGFILAFFVFTFMLWVASGWVPNSWEYFTPGYMSKRAMTRPNNSAAVCNNSYYGNQATNSTCSEYPWAWLPSHYHQVNSNLVWAFWTDSMVFHLHIWIAVVLSLIFNSFGFTRYLLRLRTPKFPLVGSFTMGTLLAWYMYGSCVVFWLIYWGHDHNWDNNYPPHQDKVDAAARVFGQAAILFEATLLYPASRNSFIPLCFGVSWEACLSWHRIVGYLMLVATFFHMILWWISYYQHDLFPHDAYAIPQLRQASVDNWTVPYVTYASWAMFLCMGVFAFYKIRRKWFELFYYTHHIFLIVIPASMYHAAGGWFYLVPPATLWFFDRLVRWLRGTCTHVIVQNVRKGAHTTELQLSVDGKFGYLMGQYAFLNIPAISVFEWHPFTISSAPYDPFVTFHIKSMGKHTWSGELAALSTKQLLPVYIDGPYGCPIHWRDYDVLVMIAGGIGFTPVHSILRGLLMDESAHRLMVRVVWTVRSSAMLGMFDDTLSEVLKSDYKHIHVTLHVTGGDNNNEHTNLPFQTGRPNLDRIFSELPQNNKTLAFVCGPSVMAEEVEKVAYDHNTHFHAETFEL